eukprot:TRINITY_DN7295_c0_g1_i3.p1 TRINITY_DN7295_c0_g1~~TRINITY_DN7295_c0_g1_i3.p1  ORF type:complete len:671 (-),score=125.25 TRINITY_DN7295_c0_g1_i3:79-2091(-)
MKLMLLLLYLSSQAPRPASAQSSFSPFSLLGSLFSSAPSWPRPRQVRQRKPQPPQQQIFFRPNLPTGQKFSASQQVQKLVRFPNKKNKNPFPQNLNPRGVKGGRNPQQQVIRITSPSNYSLTTPEPTTYSSIAVSVLNVSQTSPVSSTWSEPVTEILKRSQDLFTTSSTSDDVTEVYSEVNNDNTHTTIVTNDIVEVETVRNNQENVQVIYPTSVKENVIKLDKNYTNDKLNEDINISNNNLVTEQSPTFGSFAGRESEISGPNPGEYPVIAQIDEQSNNYYDQVFQSVAISKDSAGNANPYYAPEEFNYNQEPIVLNHIEAKEIESLIKPEEFRIKPRGETYQDLQKDVSIFKIENVSTEASTTKLTLTDTNTTHSSLQDEFVTDVRNIVEEPKGKTPKSVDFDKLLIPQRLYDHHSKSHPNEIIKLVNTIEYRATDYKGTEKDISKGYRRGVVGGVDYLPVSNNLTDSLAALVDCGAGSEIGFCSMTSSYPKERVHALMYDCGEILEAFQAVVTDDLDELGDNSPSVISSEKDLTRPWSWKVYAYKKRQICHSELYFLQPAFARDTKGSWHIILQTDTINQRVAIDMCHHPNKACPGVSDCGKKSRCVQRYNYQLLLSLPSSLSSTSLCPSIRAFKFPSGCVCHAETKSDQDLVSDTNSHHHNGHLFF